MEPPLDENGPGVVEEGVGDDLGVVNGEDYVLTGSVSAGPEEASAKGVGFGGGYGTDICLCCSEEIVVRAETRAAIWEVHVVPWAEVPSMFWDGDVDFLMQP